MSVSRKRIKTPLGVIEYLWLDGGLVPFEVLRETIQTPEGPVTYEFIPIQKGEPQLSDSPAG